MSAQVLYLVLINGRPSCWAGTREEATAVAKQLQERERQRRGNQKGQDWLFQGYGEQSYSVMGVTDSPFGDPEADTLEQQAKDRVAILEAGIVDALEHMDDKQYTNARRVLDEVIK